MKFLNQLTLLLVLFIMSSTALAQSTLFEAGESGFDGYDLVSYYQSDTPVKGKTEFSVQYRGVKLVFASSANLESFNRNPEKYWPSYDGWCAITMVRGDFVRPDYSMYKIQDDQLHFFAVRAFFNGLTLWDKDPDKNKILADHNFKIISEGRGSSSSE
jgi:YHS domain-containing protein